MSKLPVLLSIPHGGTRKPEELEGHLSITNKDLFDDSDPFVTELYDLGDKVKRVIKTDIARAFVDLNRSLQDMPPQNPDGLIKSKTCYEKPIYIKGREPDDSLRNMLIEMYYKPYHETIQKSISELDLQLCLDCHSMADIAPSISPDRNQMKRPKFCLSNNDGQASSDEMMELLASCLSESFGIERKDISLNEPFHGGHITKMYGNNPIPWIQIEMNRDLYLSGEWFDDKTLNIDKGRLSELNEMFEDALVKFCNKSFKEDDVIPFLGKKKDAKAITLKRNKKKSHKSKTIVLRSQMTVDEIDELVEKKKANYFRHLLRKPGRSEVHVHSLVLTYEPYMIVSGKYEADFFRKAVHTIKVDNKVKEVVLQEGMFPVSAKSSILGKIERKHGKNHVDLELEEHVWSEQEEEITIDHHGEERDFSYKVHANIQENYPKRILEKNNKKDFEFTKEDAIQKLNDKLRERQIDFEVRDLNEKFTINEILEVYIPIYEARLVGPKKKVEIMRVDAVKKKVI